VRRGVGSAGAVWGRNRGFRFDVAGGVAAPFLVVGGGGRRRPGAELWTFDFGGGLDRR